MGHGRRRLVSARQGLAEIWVGPDGWRLPLGYAALAALHQRPCSFGRIVRRLTPAVRGRPVMVGNERWLGM